MNAAAVKKSASRGLNLLANGFQRFSRMDILGSMNARKIVSGYLIVQSLGTGLWWGILFFVPESARWFLPTAWPEDSLVGFWLSDILLLTGGSAFAAYVVLQRKPWADTAVWSVTAASWYPTLYCIGVSLMTDQAWLASAMMVCMAGLMLVMATIYGHSGQTPATFRVTAMNKTPAIAWSMAQLLIFWSTFLWILPKGIFELEHRLNVPGFNVSQLSSGMAVILFSAASLLGFASCVTMAMLGNGTPMPTATAPKLVIAGPYRFVRNPMSLAGILQGIAVGWFMGSYSVIVYAILGAFVWHLLVCPVEEKDLQKRFGDRYLQYQQAVGLWIPRFSRRST